MATTTTTTTTVILAAATTTTARSHQTQAVNACHKPIVGGMMQRCGSWTHRIYSIMFASPLEYYISSSKQARCIVQSQMASKEGPKQQNPERLIVNHTCSPASFPSHASLPCTRLSNYARPPAKTGACSVSLFSLEPHVPVLDIFCGCIIHQYASTHRTVAQDVLHSLVLRNVLWKF